MGFAYNRVKNFNRRYRMGRGPGGFSLSDYIATLTNRAGVTGMIFLFQIHMILI